VVQVATDEQKWSRRARKTSVAGINTLQLGDAFRFLCYFARNLWFYETGTAQFI
jgi:hypothetical protein